MTGGARTSSGRRHNLQLTRHSTILPNMLRPLPADGNYLEVAQIIASCLDSRGSGAVYRVILELDETTTSILDEPH